MTSPAEPFGRIPGPPESRAEDEVLSGDQPVSEFTTTGLGQLVDQRRETEAAFDENSRWMRKTMSNIGDGVICCDTSGNVAFMNPVAEAILGQSREATCGKPVTSVFRLFDSMDSQPLADLRALTQRCDDTGRQVLRGTLVRADQGHLPVEVDISILRDESQRRLGPLLVFRDITAQLSAEEAQARLAAIVESSDDAIVSKSLDGTVRTWNAGAERLFGYSAEEMIGQSITRIIPPERLGEEHDVLDRLRRGDRIDHFETVRLARDGRLIDISLSVSPLRDATGRIIGASKVARDISVAKRAAGLQREADRRKDEFLALLAHELRNPLAPLRNGLQLIRLANGNPESANRVREMMDRQLAHLVRLVDDLLDISRITQNKIQLRRGRIALADALEHALETIRPQIQAAGHQLEIAIPPQSIKLDADLTRLAQVFGNLLSNSAKYTPPGGRITVSVSQLDDVVEVAVRDNGIGIPSAALPHIFDMFSQVDRSVEKFAGGLGIGLALVKALVEMHGGTVSATSSSDGGGSVFTVRLPIDQSASDDVTSPPLRETEEASTRRRILVVDDNLDSAGSMEAILTLLGHEVYTAHDGLEAVEVAARVRPDAVLMDVGMPRLGGYEATRRIRSQPGGKEVLIIALTGWGQDEDRARSRVAGCDAHLVKPIDIDEVEQLLPLAPRRPRTAPAGEASSSRDGPADGKPKRPEDSQQVHELPLEDT